MPPAPDPPFDPRMPGISLDELAEAFTQAMGVRPRPADEPAAPQEVDDPSEAVADGAAEDGAPSPDSSESTKEDVCPISPRTILEAMLFVGNGDDRPLTPQQAAERMRDVECDEIPSLVEELNQRYDSRGAPYRIVGAGDGYRLALRPEFQSLGDRFHGRIREARLSQAAIDVLALVAYEQPVAAEKLGRLRGKPSSHVLAHLVRRGLLRIERPDPKRRTAHYCTTNRFLKLFGIESLADLPRSEDSGPP